MIELIGFVADGVPRTRVKGLHVVLALKAMKFGGWVYVEGKASLMLKGGCQESILSGSQGLIRP